MKEVFMAKHQKSRKRVEGTWGRCRECGHQARFYLVARCKQCGSWKVELERGKQS